MNTASEQKSKGTFLVALAKVWFVFTGFTTQILLPHLFNNAAQFGIYKVAMNGISLINNVMITATLQTVSKLMSENPNHRDGTLRQALIFQIALGFFIAGGLALLAPSIGMWARDMALVGPLRLGALVVFSYAIYATLVGALNGQENFATQARLDIGFSTLRTIGLLVGASLGFGAIGSFAGFAIAALVITMAALYFVRSGSPSESSSFDRMISFLKPAWLYHLLLNTALLLDAWLLKRGITNLALKSHMSSVDAQTLSSQYSAYYGAAQSFAFVPYQLVIAVTLIIFPMISRATATNDEQLARTTVRHAMRFTWIILLACAAPIIGAPDAVFQIVFPAEYIAGASALRILICGVISFTLFSVGSTVISGAGQPSMSAFCAAIAVVTLVIVNPLVINYVGLNNTTLSATATATSFSMLAACTAVSFAVYRRFQTWIPLKSFIRGLLCAVTGIMTSALIPHNNRAMSLIALCSGLLTYLVMLLLLGEISLTEQQKIKALFKKKV